MLNEEGNKLKESMKQNRPIEKVIDRCLFFGKILNFPKLYLFSVKADIMKCESYPLRLWNNTGIRFCVLIEAKFRLQILHNTYLKFDDTRLGSVK